MFKFFEMQFTRPKFTQPPFTPNDIYMKPGAITFLFNRNFRTKEEQLITGPGNLTHPQLAPLLKRGPNYLVAHGRVAKGLLAFWWDNDKEVIKLATSCLMGHFPELFTDNMAISVGKKSKSLDELGDVSPRKCSGFIYTENPAQEKEKDSPDCDKIDFDSMMAGLHSKSASERDKIRMQACNMKDPDAIKCPKLSKQVADLKSRSNCKDISDQEAYRKASQAGKMAYSQQMKDFLRNPDSTSVPPGVPLRFRKKDLDDLYRNESFKIWLSENY